MLKRIAPSVEVWGYGSSAIESGDMWHDPIFHAPTPTLKQFTCTMWEGRIAILLLRRAWNHVAHLVESGAECKGYMTLCVVTRPTHKRARIHDMRTGAGDTRHSAPVPETNVK